MSELMRKIVYYENILEFKENTNSALNVTELNNWQLCRTCLIETSDDDVNLERMCVMDVIEGRFLNVREMLINATGLEISNDEKLPLNVCQDCLGKITTMYYFNIQVRKAEMVLKRLNNKLMGEIPMETLATEEENASIKIQQDEIVNNSEQDEEAGNFNNHTEEYILNDMKLQQEEIFNNTEEKEEACYSINQTEEYIFNDVNIQQDNNLELQEIHSINENDQMSEEYIESQECLEDFPNQTDVKDDNTKNIDYNTIPEYLQEDNEEEKYLDTDSIDSTANETNVEDISKFEHVPDELFFKSYQFEDASNLYDSKKQLQTINMKCEIEKPLKLRFKHKQPRVKKRLLDDIKCAACQKIFCRQRDLVKHVQQLHPNTKAYKCRDCDMAFAHMQSLSRHMNSHKDVLIKLICEFCSKSFVRVDDLKRHVRVHTGERPYSCPLCEKSFKQQGEMKAHQSTHFPQLKSFACDQCNRSFTSRNGLYLHKKTHLSQHDHGKLNKKVLKTKQKKSKE